MSHPVLILILVLALPTLEIYLLIQLGSAIGFFGTLLLVLGGAVLGGWLLRHQGLGSLARIRAALERGESPTLELLDGVLILLGGALLILPGPATDLLGLLCLAPWPRRWLLAWLAPRLVVTSVSTQAPGPRRAGDLIEGEFRREQD